MTHRGDMGEEGVKLLVSVEDALLCPGGRFLWLVARSRQTSTESLRILDLDRDRVHRELREILSLRLVPSQSGPQVFRTWTAGHRKV